MTYQAPLKDINFIINDVFDATTLWKSFGISSEITERDTIYSILDEAARLATNELYPLNSVGDQQGLSLNQGEVTTPDGFKQAYKHWASGGWVGLSGDLAYGGMGFPKSLSMCVEEMMFSSNQAFALYPLLSAGGCHLISNYASENIKKLYLPNIYSGKWAATMCLTESHCGSDLGLLRTKATQASDNSYRISGEKIFITGGEQDFTDNIIHLVLARLPDAPKNVKGISLFLVPKFLVDEKGNINKRNNVTCSGLENKMGIKAAATCVMSFDQAQGYLIGKPNQGLSVMFSMMNYERLSIAMQGLGAGETSYQVALSYAKNRQQGRSQRYKSNNTVPIIEHGDVRRMLLTMKALNEAGRAFSFYVATFFDQCKNDTKNKTKILGLLSLMTPVVKGFLTDMGFDVCVIGQQVLGGHGYIKEWGQEQLVRDVRIGQIYEGTNGIQAIDLLERKIIADKGHSFNELIIEIHQCTNQCKNTSLNNLALTLEKSTGFLKEITEHFIKKSDSDLINTSSVEYLHLFGYVAFGYMWLKMAIVAENKQIDATKDMRIFYATKIKTAHFYFEKILPRIYGLKESLKAGISAVFTLDENEF